MDSINIINAANWVDKVDIDGCTDAYIAGTCFHISAFFRCGGLGESLLTITDLSNAFVRGKECHKYRIQTAGVGVMLKLIKSHDGDIGKLFKAVEALEFNHKNIAVIDQGAVMLSAKKGVKTYSPFHLDRVKPLKEAPKKLTLAHAVKMLINRQFDNLRTTGKYSDDYLRDSENNYGVGPYCPDALVRTLIEDGSGWIVSGGAEDNVNVTIRCYTFDNKACTLNLGGSRPKTSTPRTSQKSNVIAFPNKAERTRVAGIIF